MPLVFVLELIYKPPIAIYYFVHSVKRHKLKTTFENELEMIAPPQKHMISI